MIDRSFEVGEPVVDREDPRSRRQVIMALPATTAANWLAYGGVTVAQSNPGYPADASIALVVAAADVETYLPQWDGETSLPRATLDETGVYYEALPTPRLTPITTDEVTDRDAETANDFGLE